MENEVNRTFTTDVAVTTPVSNNSSSKQVEIIKGVFSYLLFNYFLLFVAVVAAIFIPNLDLEDYGTLIALDVISSSVVAIVLMYLYKGLMISDKEKIKEQGKQGIRKFFEMCLIGFLAFMGVKLLAGMLESTVFEIFGLEYETSDNQSLIEEMTGSAPLLMAISACIMAPINEELIYRGMIGKIIKNKKVFITVSGLIFGLVHVTGSILLIFEIVAIGLILDWMLNDTKMNKSDRILLSVTGIVTLLIICGGIYYFQFGNLLVKIQSLDVKEIIGSITYIIMGLYLAHYYTKHNSILLNMGIHSLNNIFSMVILLFFY